MLVRGCLPAGADRHFVDLPGGGFGQCQFGRLCPLVVHGQPQRAVEPGAEQRLPARGPGLPPVVRPRMEDRCRARPGRSRQQPVGVCRAAGLRRHFVAGVEPEHREQGARTAGQESPAEQRRNGGRQQRPSRAAGAGGDCGLLHRARHEGVVCLQGARGLRTVHGRPLATQFCPAAQQTLRGGHPLPQQGLDAEGG